MPTHNSADYLQRTLDCLYRLHPQPYLYIFSENNSTDGTVGVIERFTRKKQIVRSRFRKNHYDHSDTRYDVVGGVRQQLLQLSRELNPDYAVFLDSDVWPQTRKLIPQLTRHGKDIVAGPMYRYYPQGMFLNCLWHGRNGHKYQYRLLPNSLEGLEQVMAVGGGCMCLSRKIIQDHHVNFYPVKRPWLQEECSEDYGYCLDAARFGYECWLDTSIPLKHYSPQNERMRKPWLVNSQGKVLPFIFAK